MQANHPLPNFEAGRFTRKTCRSLNIGGKTTEKNYISNDYHDYLLIHPDLSALCSDAFWNFYRGGLWTALPRPSTWHDAPVSSAHSEQSSSEWTGDWRKLHGGYPTNLVFLPIKWIKMDSNGPWHGILQEFLGISWWWAPMEPRKQHLESGLKKPRWIGGAHIISGETHWDSTLWWWYIHMIIYICIHKYIYDHIWV